MLWQEQHLALQQSSKFVVGFGPKQQSIAVCLQRVACSAKLAAGRTRTVPHDKKDFKQTNTCSATSAFYDDDETLSATGKETTSSCLNDNHPENRQ